MKITTENICPLSRKLNWQNSWENVCKEFFSLVPWDPLELDVGRENRAAIPSVYILFQSHESFLQNTVQLLRLRPIQFLSFQYFHMEEIIMTKAQASVLEVKGKDPSLPLKSHWVSTKSILSHFSLVYLLRVREVWLHRSRLICMAEQAERKKRGASGKGQAQLAILLNTYQSREKTNTRVLTEGFPFLGVTADTILNADMN